MNMSVKSWKLKNTIINLFNYIFSCIHVKAASKQSLFLSGHCGNAIFLRLDCQIKRELMLNRQTPAFNEIIMVWDELQVNRCM